MKKQPIIPFLISNVYICDIMDNSNSIKHSSVTPEEAVKEARHVTWVGFWCNAALGTAKVIAGIVGRWELLSPTVFTRSPISLPM